MSARLQSAATADALLGLLQLGQRTREAENTEELAFIAVNETRNLLDYRQSALWLGGVRQMIAALSGAALADRSGPYVQWLERLFKATTGAAGSPEPRRLHAGDLPPLAAEEWGQWLPRDALLIPLARRGGIDGCLLLAREGAWRDDELGLARELGRLYGHALFALRPGERLPARALAALLSRSIWRKMWWRTGLALLAVLCIPVRLSVLMPAEITPLDPFVVRAPLEGVIDRFQVQPNAAVAAGASLFNLDTTTLQSRHATAREAYKTAQEAYRQSAQLAVTDDRAKLEMMLQKGALGQKAVDLAYSASQLERVQVKAERAGVAIFTDVHDWIGRAVTTGEKVLVLADPTKVELTAHMSAGDQIAVAPGAKIVFFPNAAPFSSYTAIVDSVAYYAEPTGEAVLAFRIRAHFAENEPRPRLGLMGSARVYAGRTPLIYMILRRPLAVARQWLG